MPRVYCLEATPLHLRSHSCLRPPYYGMTRTSPFWETHLISSSDWISPSRSYLPSYLRLSVSFAASISRAADRSSPPPPCNPRSPPIHFNRPRRPGAPLAQNVSSGEREEDPDLHTTSQSQAANHGLPSSTTTATPKSPRDMHGFAGRGGTSSRMGPPPVPSLQPGHHQGSPPTSSGIQHRQHQPQPGYPTSPVGSMDGRFRVDDGQSPSGLCFAQQQQQKVDGYPIQQYPSPAQAHLYGSSAQPTNPHFSQSSQPFYGYSPTFADPSYSQHAHPAHAPTRNPSMYAVPIPTAPIPTVPSQWTIGGSAQGQEQYYYSGAAAYSEPQPPYTSPTHATRTYQVHTPAGSSSDGSRSIARPTPPIPSGPIPCSATLRPDMRPPSSSAGSRGVAGYSSAFSAVGPQVPHGGGGGPVGTGLTAPVMMDSVIGGGGENSFEYGLSEFPPKLLTLATPVGIFSPDYDSSSRVPPSLSQANLTASGEIPNSGAVPGGPNASVGDTSTMAEPTSHNRHIGPSRSDRTNRRPVSKPYQRLTRAARKTRPITYEGNLARLQQRCRIQGADEGAIGLLAKVFANEISLEALIRLLTDAEVDTKEFGFETGRIYIAFLDPINEEEGEAPYFVCRLCHTEQVWRHHKDVLRHLRRDHFGFADVCEQWYVFGRSLLFMKINMFHDDVAAKSSTPKRR